VHTSVEPFLSREAWQAWSGIGEVGGDALRLCCWLRLAKTNLEN